MLRGNSGLAESRDNVFVVTFFTHCPILNRLTRPLPQFLLQHSWWSSWELECCSNPFGRNHIIFVVLSSPSPVMVVVVVTGCLFGGGGGLEMI